MDNTNKFLFLIGHPVSHSKSPAFQNAALKELGISAVYLAIDIRKEDFETVINGLKKTDLLGFNITVPYKKDIISYCDILGDDAKTIKSVNTIIVENGKWIGRNTDWFGVYKSLENCKYSDKTKVLIIGAGGATNGVIYGLNQLGINDICITNRTESKAEQLASEFDIKFTPYNELNHSQNYDIVINTTTVTFNNLIGNFDDNTLYFDLKYYSEKVNCKQFIDGSEMLLWQGAKAFELWTKKDAPVEIMRKALQ